MALFGVGVFLWPCLALGVSAFFMRKNGKKRPGRPLRAESPFQAISRRSCCCCALFGATRSCSSLAAVCAYIFIFTYKSEKKPRKKGGAKKFPAPALLAFCCASSEEQISQPTNQPVQGWEIGVKWVFLAG